MADYPIGSAFGGGVLIGNTGMGPTTGQLPVSYITVPGINYSNTPPDAGPLPNQNPAPTNPPASDPTKTSGGETIGGEPDIVVDGKLFSSQADYERWKAGEAARAAIESGYNNYFTELDNILNSSLPSSKTAQEDIVASQKTEAETTLGGQKTQGLADLNTARGKITGNQNKTLRDLSEDVRNLFRAGNIYLGARGAGDSSATNMYSYAIGKIGSKARGGVLEQATALQSQVDDKEFALKNTYNTELNNLTSQANTKMAQIAQWFADAQTQIGQMKAQGQLQKGQDLANLNMQLLNNATQMLMQAQTEYANQKTALQQWAMNNSTTIGQLKQNLAALSQGSQTGINAPNMNAQWQGGSSGPTSLAFSPGFGYGKEEKNKVNNFA